MGIRAKSFDYKQFRKKGFTLLEVAASLLAFSIVVVIFASSIVMAYKTAHINGQYTQAISLCQHKIDQLRSMGLGKLTYDELSGAAEVIDPTPTDPSCYSFTGVDDVASYLPGSAATLKIETPYNGDDKKAKVTATVSWRPLGKNKDSSLSLVAIVTNVE